MSIITNAIKCAFTITGKNAATNGGDAVLNRHGTHRKAPPKRGFFYGKRGLTRHSAALRKQTRMPPLYVPRENGGTQSRTHAVTPSRCEPTQRAPRAIARRRNPHGEEMNSMAAAMPTSCRCGVARQAALVRSNAVVTSASSNGSTFAASVSSYAYGICSSIYVICDNSSCTACTPCAGCPYCRVM